MDIHGTGVEGATGLGVGAGGVNIPGVAVSDIDCRIGDRCIVNCEIHVAAGRSAIGAVDGHVPGGIGDCKL